MSQPQPDISLSDAPSIPGLTFRLYRGEADNTAIEAVRQQVRAVDGDIWFPGPDTDTDSVCDPMRDCLLAEVAGKVIGCTWLTWWSEADRACTPARRVGGASS